MVPVKHAAAINGAVLPEGTPGDFRFLYVDISAVDGDGTLDVPEDLISFDEAPSRARRIAQPGSTIVSTVRTYLRAIGRVPATAEPLVLSTGFATLEAKAGVHPDYLYYACRSEQFVDEVVARSSGVSYPAINPTELGCVSISLPTMREQARIARFLDDQTTRIDSIIAARRQHIERIGELTTTLITDTITGSGKRSGGWPHRKLKYLGTAITGLTYSPADISEPGEGTLVLRSGNVQDGQIVLDDCVYVACPVPPGLRLVEGDILICSRNGSAQLIGKNATVPESAAGHTWGAFMTVFRSPLNDYVSWVLQSNLFLTQLGLYATATINQLTLGMLNEMSVPVPPEDERRGIMRSLASAVGDLRATAGYHATSMALMNEFKRSLISAAVSGEFDVTTASGRGVPA